MQKESRTAAPSRVIKGFLDQYEKMNNDYKIIRDHAQNIVETTLKDAGIMSITSSRIKENDSLLEKLTQRNKEKNYQTEADIKDDIPDFIGIRIALYFPSDKDLVQTLIHRLFDIEKIKQFPDEQRQNGTYTRTFCGYCATHYRVFLKKPPRTALGNPRIEIQVASLLMHAWSEVEHDLTYKQKKGRVSYEEYESLDEINGLVLAGELSLQRLRRISELRISLEKKEFENHYQLASFLYEKATFGNYLGDVETLFKLLKIKDRLTAKKIENDLSKIDRYHDIPIAQQLIDLYSDSSVDASQLVISNKIAKAYGVLTDDVRMSIDDSQIGAFLRRWVGLEKALSELLLRQGYRANKPGGIQRAVVDSKILPEYVMQKYTMLKEIRNKIVHNLEMPDKYEFERYVQMMDEISCSLESNYVAMSNL